MESKKINQLATELTPSLSDLTIIGDPSTGISKKITLSQMASLFTGTVEEYANVAAFPLVGVADTIYIALDTNVLYRWNTGTNAYVELSPNIINSLVFNDANGFDGTISLVGSVATLTITTALTTGSVGFIGASGALLQDNANFFWDDTNNRLGLGTNAPTTAIDVFGSGIIGRLNGTSTNNAFLGFASAGSNKWSIGNVQSDHRFRIYNEATTSELVSVLSTGEFGIGIANPTTKFHIDGAASALIANLDANVSVAKSLSFRSDNSNRINLEVSGTESGSNAGADFFIRRYSDAGSLIDTPLTIIRSTGNATFSGILTTPQVKAATSAGLSINANSGTQVADFGAGGSANMTLFGGLSGTSATFSGALSSNSLTLTNALSIANGGTGVTSLTSGHILFGNGTTALTTTSNFFWDNVSYRLGLLNSSPSYTLDVNGTARITGAAIFTGNVTQNINDGTIGLYKADGTTPKAFLGNPDGSNTDEGYLELYKTSVSKVKLRANGNSYFNGGFVGINKTDPATFLHIVGSNTTGRGQLCIQSNNTSNAARASWYYDTNLQGNIGTTSADFYVESVNTLVLLPGNGNTTRGGTIREFTGSVSPPSPYTADLRLTINHDGWGGNNDSGTVYVEYQGRAYGNNQTTVAYGVITYRLDSNGVSITNVSTAGVTVSNVTLSTNISSNYILRITFGVSVVVDRASIFARTTNSFVSSMSVDTV